MARLNPGRLVGSVVRAGPVGRVRLIGLVGGLLLALCLAGCSSATAPAPSAPAPAPSARGSSSAGTVSPGTVSARTLLSSLRVESPDREHPYRRAAFGYGEDFDPDHDGCYTQREVLIRDHLGPIRVGSSCFVTSTWRSLYDDRVTSEPRTLSIDHLVPLAEAWHAGAWRWSERRLIAYGNDLGYPWSLQAVTAALNEDKGSQDPAQWLPPANRCTYAAAWIAVKARWDLSVDPSERQALLRVLDTCASVEVLDPGRPDLAALTGSGGES